MKTTLIPLFTAAVLTAPAEAQAVREWTGGTGGAWLTTGSWTGGTWAGESPLANPGGEGLATDIMTTAAGNSASNIGINMNTLTAGAGGVGLILGGIDFNKTNATKLQIGNSSGTVNGILRLSGATINSVANTLVRVAGSADLTIANVNTGTGSQTMGLQLGITDGIFDVASGRTLTISSKVTELNAGTGFTKTGAGTLSLATTSVANELTGTITVKEGSLALATNTGNDAGAAGTAAITLGDTTGSAAATLTVNNSITPTNALTVATGSSGVKTLTTGNVSSPGYDGAITLNDNLTVAMLNTGSASTNFTFAGAGNINLNAKTLNLSLTQGASGNTNTATITLNKPVVGTGGIVISGSGLSTGTRTVALNGTNTYTGGTTVGGTGTNRNLVVDVTGDQSAATGGWNIDISNESTTVTTTVNFATDSTVAVASGKAITLGGTGGHFGARTLNAAGTVTNDGTLLVRRSSTVNVTGSWTQNGFATIATQGGGWAALTIGAGGSFTYTSTGNFRLNTSTSNDTETNLSINGGTFTTGIDIRNNTSGLSPLNSAFAQITLNDGGTLKLSADVPQLLTTAGGNIRMRVGETGTGGILDTNGFHTTIDKEITDVAGQAGKLTKQGAGVLTLDGANTYTGDTLVSAGTLRVNGSLGNTAVTVAGGASIGGTGSLGGSLSLAAGSFLGVADLNDPLAVAGSITFGSGFGIANLTGINWDSLGLNTPHTILSTTQTFGAGDIGNFGYDNRVAVGSLDREAYFANGSLAVVVIPEPAAALLGGFGLLALLRRRRAWRP